MTRGGFALDVAVKNPAAGTAVASPKRAKAIFGFRRAVLRVVFPFREYLPENAVTPQEAVTSFLGTMASTAGRTSGLWRQQLDYGLDSCALTFEERRDFLIIYPVEDYYFTGVVALEAVRIRQVYTPAEADALFGEIGDQLDRAANRGDRVLSDLLFDIIGRIDLSATPGVQKMPHDIVTKTILRQLDLDRTEATRDLMRDKAFRHSLGEPLALGIQNWWAAFAEKFVLHIPPEPEPEELDDAYVPVPQMRAPVRPHRRLKRAVEFI